MAHEPLTADPERQLGGGPASAGGQPASALLAVEQVTTVYGDTVAVDRLSFSVGEGEFFTLLGPSGCGKSTTLMSLAGFELPASGSIHLRGRDITREAPDRRGMGVVFQSYALFPHMSVLENVMFPLRMRGMARAETQAKARDMLEVVELGADFHGTRPANLSGGQQQRVALARAMVFDPDVLLMDEPLAALDRRLRQALQFELRHLQARLGTTVIYVTHDQEEALVLSDRIGVMRDGRFEQLGTPREVYDRPRSAFVANFLGGANRTPVRVLERQGGEALVEPSGSRALRATATELPAGDREALLLVRPENVRVSPVGEGRAAGDDGPSAEVTDIAFLGDHVRVEVRVFGDESWAAKAHPATLQGVRPGAAVELGWQVADARLVALA